mmetsp:Transcript_48464/g.73226  ORF Transcript_48464/g.73226 Transcript_48464/m.73226 type:complete len:549 (-) Transcript_48464:346-1992(-)
MTNNFSPRYDSAQNPAYFIDFTASSSGKRLSGTKRQIRWRFGFSNREAIENGSTGPACRGEEHEVSLTWSLTSGKRTILFDGEQLHYSMGKISQSKFEFDWMMFGKHTMKVIAYAAPTLRATTNFRQFDLLLDGRSVFDLPRIFELGSDRKLIMSPKSTYERYNHGEMERAQTMHTHGERRLIHHSGSLQSSAYAHPQPERSQSLPPYQDFAMPSDLISEPTPMIGEQDLISSPLPLLDQSNVDTLHYSLPTLDYSPPITQAPSFEEISGKIMDAYASPSSQQPSNADYSGFSDAIVVSTEKGSVLKHYGIDIKSNEQHSPACIIEATNDGSSFFSQPFTPEPKRCYPTDCTHNQTNPYYVSPEATPKESPRFFDRLWVPSSPSNDSLENISTKEDYVPTTPIDELGASIQKLVNIEDIRSLPEEQMLAKLRTTPYEKSKTQHKTFRTSRGLPPTPTSWHIGQDASLSQIRCVKSSKTQSVQVMNTYATNPGDTTPVAEGQMIVYGGHTSLTNGPPPIPRVTGFGIGAQVKFDQYSVKQQHLPGCEAY